MKLYLDNVSENKISAFRFSLVLTVKTQYILVIYNCICLCILVALCWNTILKANKKDINLTVPANKKCSENVVVTKNYNYGNVAENVVTCNNVILDGKGYVSKNVTPNNVRKFTQQLWNVFNFIGTRENISVTSWELSNNLLKTL